MNPIIGFLNQIALSAMRQSGVVGALFVIAVVFMMITPLPTALVDVLIAINICISCLLIMLAMHLPRPLAFSTFPSVLLLTTMFRLALSISTTRLILLEQDAGHIVEAFGQFVVGGNLAVGMVIFMILTIVNFMVITKGSERVAEVGARFTLDAMPGKQMSIDTDLRSNLITVEEARRRRSDLGKESQMFGAMDGAMKFVNGDAIASLIIVFVNLIGGISIGVVQRGMAAGDALQLYSVLTIGDGLIAQIPALLISITAGMVITRVPNDGGFEEANIGRDIAEQLTSQPRAWILASVAMVGFAALPGMPTNVFITIAVISGCGGLLQLRRARIEREAQAPVIVAPEENGKEDIRKFYASRPFLLQFHPKQNREQIDVLVSEIRQRRNRLVALYGITLPSFVVEDASDLEADEFRFSVNEVPIMTATFTDRYVAIDTRDIEHSIEESYIGDPARGEEQWLWVEVDAAHAQDSAVEVLTATTLIVDRMDLALKSCGPQFIGLRESKAILNWLESEQPELAQEVQRVLPLTRFSMILQRLASEGVPLRAMRLIAETLIEFGQHEREVSALVDYVRIALRAMIFNQHTGPKGLLVWLLTPESEGILRDSLRQTQTETYLSLSPETAQNFVYQLHIAFPARAKEKQVLLVAQDIRSPMRSLLKDEFHHVPIMSFPEIGSTSQIEVVGRFDLDDEQGYLDDEIDDEDAA